MTGTRKAHTGAEISAPVRLRNLLRAACAAIVFAAAASASAVENGKPAPDFTLPVLGSADKVGLAQLKGKIVFVDFWASWCGPCRQSLPQYDKLNTELAAQDFRLLAINLDEDDADANGFLKEHPVHYTVLRDPAGAVPKAFGLVGMPTSYLIDRDGVVRAQHSGFNPSDIDTLRKQVHDLLETRGDAH